MDWRILIVFGPIILAASWALFNIAKAAIAQVQEFLDKEA